MVGNAFGDSFKFIKGTHFGLKMFITKKKKKKVIKQNVLFIPFKKKKYTFFT